MSYENPTEIRLSEHFLLSDLMGCHSVYAKGYANVFDTSDRDKLREGVTLARKLLEPLLDRSRLSVTYGYISPALSRKIVKYQDPDKPSYHRWDDGAACDVVLHQYIHAGVPPIYAAFWIDENLPTSRTITYSESPCICVATRREEIKKGDPRRALYENRYVGERKPLYIPYSNNGRKRTEQKAQVDLTHVWQGNGYPTYHGGGIMQAQHIRTSKYTLLSDFLMSPEAMSQGFVNMPPLSPTGPNDELMPTQRTMARFIRAGLVYDSLLEATGARRLSIVQAYQSETWRGEAKSNWKDGAYVCIVPPESMEPDTLAHEAEQIGAVSKVQVSRDGRVWLTMLDKDKNEGTKKVQAAPVTQAEEPPATEWSGPRLRRTRKAT